MPDLTTALQKAIENKLNKEKQMQTRTTTPDNVKQIIDQWAEDDPRDEGRPLPPHIFKPTNNVSRETFNAVRDNPRLQHKDLVRLLSNRGFNAASIGSLLTQMHNSGMLAKDDMGRYTALQTEYTPIKASKRVKSKKVAVPATKRKAEKAGIAALDTQDTVPKKLVALQQRTDHAPFDPEHSLSTLSFAQVMALYKKIKTMLGEA